MILATPYKFVVLAETAKKIVDNGALTWRDKYELVFSDEIKGRIDETGVEVVWYDPDMDYEDDVMAYVNALMKKADRLRTLFQGD